MDIRGFRRHGELVIPAGEVTQDGFLRMFAAYHVNVTPWAENVSSKLFPLVYKQEKRAKVAFVRPSQMGARGEVSRQDIYDDGLRSGLGLLPADLALWLRLQYLGKDQRWEQPWDEWLNVAMEPIEGSDVEGSSKNLSIFSLERHGHRDNDSDQGFYFDCVSGSPRIYWSPNEDWAFLVPEFAPVDAPLVL